MSANERDEIGKRFEWGIIGLDVKILDMEEIIIDDFAKIEIRAGLVEEAIIVEKSDKLIRLRVRFGEDEVRTIFSGIRKWYSPEDLINKKFGFVYNLKPRQMMGEESCGMIMAFDDEDRAILWEVPEEVAMGALVR